MAATRFIRWFGDVTMAVVGLVGGKNASLGEMCRELIPRGISVPNGFAITAAGYRHVLHVGGLAQQGVDVWINTPRRPWEAYGTSGMKVLANGRISTAAAFPGKRCATSARARNVASTTRGSGRFPSIWMPPEAIRLGCPERT